MPKLPKIKPDALFNKLYGKPVREYFNRPSLYELYQEVNMEIVNVILKKEGGFISVVDCPVGGPVIVNIEMHDYDAAEFTPPTEEEIKRDDNGQYFLRYTII